MTTEIAFLFTVLAVMIFLFLSNRAPVDITAMVGLMVLTLTGIVGFDQAFLGFSSPAVITMLATFILGAALKMTGMAESVAHYITAIFGDKEMSLVFGVAIFSALLSAFMNNVAATAVLLPAVVSVAHRTGTPPSKLLIPLSFGTILGGTTTLIGTAPNLVAAEVIGKSGLDAPGFFDFTPFGCLLVFLGILFIVFIGRHLLPNKDVGRRRSRRRDLASLYQLEDRMISLRIPDGSSLAGETIASACIGDLLDVQVFAIIRGGSQQLAPRPSEVLHEGDVLIVRGKLSNVTSLLRFQGVQVEQIDQGKATSISADMGSAGLRVVERGIDNWTLKDLNFRKRYGVVVAAVQREDNFIHRGLSREPLHVGDVIHVIGTSEQIEAVRQDPYFNPVDSEILVSDFLSKHLFLMSLPSESPLLKSSLRESKIGELAGITIVGVLRKGTTILALKAGETLEDGDQFLVSGEPAPLQRLSHLSELEINTEEVSSKLESDDVGIIEVVLSPRSKLLENTLKELDFREKYGFQVLAFWREGKPVRSKVGLTPLRLGDALLLQGPRKRMPLLANDPDFVVLSELVKSTRRTDKKPYALGSLILMVVLVAFGILPVHISTFLAACVAVVTGCLKMEEAYREVEWKVIFLVACLIPIGLAVDETGAATLLANKIVEVAGVYGPFAVLIALSLFASVLSQTLDGSLTVILLIPVAIQTANQLAVSPYPFLMALTLSASVAFMTPFSHKSNLLVMGAGGYQVRDYFRVGTLLSIICFVALWGLVPAIYPF